jgi:ribosomal protein S18 acetylase RimI-like enzyme
MGSGRPPKINGIRRYHGGVIFRRATPTDATTIAGIHVRGWQWAYRGLLPDAVLEGLSIETRASEWAGWLQDDAARTWIAEQDGRAVGFVCCGPAKDGTAGEIFTIYREKDAVGGGIGHALLAHALSDLASRGFLEAVLWVLEGNAHARRFYEREGWTADGARKEEPRAGEVCFDVRYRKKLR